MSIATMADRTLPLAERVSAAIKLAMESVTGTMDGTWSKRQNDLAERGCDALLADIAAADRLARAVAVYYDALDAMARDGEVDGRGWREFAGDAWGDHTKSLAAYRARIAQGVGDGHPE